MLAFAIVDMTLEPTGDVAVLCASRTVAETWSPAPRRAAAMALVLLAAAAYRIASYRGIELGLPAPAGAPRA